MLARSLGTAVLRGERRQHNMLLLIGEAYLFELPLDRLVFRGKI